MRLDKILRAIILLAAIGLTAQAAYETSPRLRAFTQMVVR